MPRQYINGTAWLDMRWSAYKWTDDSRIKSEATEIAKKLNKPAEYDGF